MTVNRKTKDTIFTKVFAEPKYAFQLYKVFHPEDMTSTENQLKIITLENVFSRGEYNDLGILMNNRIMLFVEAQSDWNGNMALRTLFYLSETYKRYVIDNDLDIMSKTAISIPVPEIYVIFTGEREQRPEELKLSELYKKDELNLRHYKNSLELTVKMIYNSKEGDVVFQYINFCKVFNMQMALYRDDKDKAVRETLRICKDKSLLDEYIRLHEAEVIDIMSDFIFNEQLLNEIHIRNEKRIAVEEAQQETARKMMAKGLSLELIMECTGLTRNQIEELQTTV